MQHLRLYDTNSNVEYFKEDRTAIFLADIKDINIIIGANNTRKSRFIRHVINTESKIIIDSKHNLNELYLNSQKIFENIDSQIADEIVAQFQIIQSNTDNRKYDLIKQFFSGTGQVRLSTFREKVEAINNVLLSFITIDSFKELKRLIEQSLCVVSILESMYNTLDKNNGIDYHSSTYRETGVHNITAVIPSGNTDTIRHWDKRFLIIKEIKRYLTLLFDSEFNQFTKPIIYIPVLRTSRMLEGGGGEEDIFEKTILNQHFSKSNVKLSIETGLKLYEKIGLARNGNLKQIRDFNAFEKFIGRSFFQSEDIHIIAHRTSKFQDKFIKISLPNELEDVSIQNLGDGVQGIINLLFPVFTAEDESWIFIDEPENHLHPGYQNLFINAISENEFIKKKKLKIFINTHSNHILTETILSSKETEIFVFSRRDSESSNIQSFNGNEYNTLEMLGVFNTSVLISNCSIWVEGITDRLYLKSFLYAYCNHLEEKAFRPTEGLHYSYIEYAGNNLLHYNFDAEFKVRPEIVNKIESYFINSNIFLLADTDFNTEKHKVYESINRSNFKYYQTQVPEIENLIPDEILKTYLIESLKCDEAEVNSCFPIKNHSVKLGKYFKDKIKYGNGYRKFEAKSGGGTLSSTYKSSLADFVHKKIMDKTVKWNDLEVSETLKDITTALYRFIKLRNGR